MNRTITSGSKASHLSYVLLFTKAKRKTVRTLTINNEPYFVGKDVAEILGYSAPRNAIATHVDDEDKTTALIQCDDSNYKSNAVVINESGLYSLILSSKLPNAKKFKRFVFVKLMVANRCK